MRSYLFKEIYYKYQLRLVLYLVERTKKNSKN